MVPPKRIVSRYRPASPLSSSEYPGSCAKWRVCPAFGKKGQKQVTNLMKDDVGKYKDESSITLALVVVWVVGLLCLGRGSDHIANSLCYY